MRQMRRMKRGEPDPRYVEIFESIATSQAATARLEAVTSLDWNPRREQTAWRKSAADLLAEGKLLFDRKRELAGLSKEFRRKLFEGAYQLISGYQELVAAWEKDHDQWVKDREKWKADNHDYMAIRPELEIFEAEHGQAAKRRQCWHKWLAFLRNRPDLAAWRGGPAAVNELDDVAKRRIEQARPEERNRVAADEFFKKNPELKALDLRHGYYQREYVRPWAKSPNPDGFKHCPTFTEPSAEKHCFWFQFKKGETYKDLDLQTCSLRLQLLASDAAEPGWEWKTFAFRPDPRLRLVRKSQDAGQGDATKFTCVFSDPALGIDRPAEVRGAKLCIPAGPARRPYLSVLHLGDAGFTVPPEDQAAVVRQVQPRVALRQNSQGTRRGGSRNLRHRPRHPAPRRGNGPPQWKNRPGENHPRGRPAGRRTALIIYRGPQTRDCRQTTQTR